VADIAGARGVTLWLAWCNVAIVEAATEVRGTRYAVRGYASVLVTVLLALAYGTWRVKTLPYRELGVVGLVQPNERYDEKGDPAHADSVVGTLLEGSRQLVAEFPKPKLSSGRKRRFPIFCGGGRAG